MKFHLSEVFIPETSAVGADIGGTRLNKQLAVQCKHPWAAIDHSYQSVVVHCVGIEDDHIKHTNHNHIYYKGV